MISFENDYSEGAHEKLLNALLETNMIQESGYGNDDFSRRAVEKIKQVIQCPEATIRFLVGGTQTNQIVINTMLENYQGVIAVNTGHVSTHEAGAIEFSGHKVLTLEGNDGKLDARQVNQYLNQFYEDANHEHMVFPGMVYISYPTEYGTLYTREELENLYKTCRKHQIPLYIDGARLGYGLMSASSDLTIADIAKLSDVFYIGGTKIGALCGEAVVFTKNNEPNHFITMVKQQGGLLAKGRLLGVQFLTLFSDNLYFELSEHAIQMANKLKQIFIDKGYRLYIDSPTNQQFFILSNQKVAELQDQIKFSIWESYDASHQIVRFATSWATKEIDIQALSKLI